MQEVRMAVTQNTCPKAVQLGSSKDALPAHLMWWYMPVIPVLRRLRQKDTEFKANQGHIMKPCLKKKNALSAYKKNPSFSQLWWVCQSSYKLRYLAFPIATPPGRRCSTGRKERWVPAQRGEQL
jgi:hypothetical protein